MVANANRNPQMRINHYSGDVVAGDGRSLLV
jgi:hypothetical protein